MSPALFSVARKKLVSHKVFIAKRATIRRFRCRIFGSCHQRGEGKKLHVWTDCEIIQTIEIWMEYKKKMKKADQCVLNFMAARIPFHQCLSDQKIHVSLLL